MRLSLLNQPEIETLSMALAQSLRALVAAITTGWNTQHNGDGGHTSITASGTLDVTGTTTLGKVNLRSVTFAEVAGSVLNNLTVAGLSSVSVLRIIPESSPMQITGIDATGRQRGDLLYVLNCDYTLDAADIQLMMENTNSSATNRFAETTASPTSVGGAVVIQGARGVLLMYDYQEAETNSTPNGARWRVLDPSV